MFNKTITTDFFTTINLNFFLRSIFLLTLKIPRLRIGKDIIKAENKLKKYLHANDSEIISLYNGRSAIYQALKLIGVKKSDEVIVNAYTCVSVSNAVIQSGAKIKYSDVDKKSLTFDIGKLKETISKKTKVIIVQHTFGKSANIKEIVSLAKKNNILIIEDCAHSLGTELNSKKIGTFGDFAIFSTGRDKVISSVTGGFLLINNKKFFFRISYILKNLVMPSRTLVIKNHLYNILAYISYKTYDFLGLGKVIMFMSKKIGLIPHIIFNNEKECDYNDFNYILPNSLAYLVKKEINNLDEYKRERRTITQFYDKYLGFNKAFLKEESKETSSCFRYPILLKNTKIKDELYIYMKKKGIILGKSWSGINIVPLGTNLKKASYKLGTCKIAEDISSRILLLPNDTKLTKKDMTRIINLLNNFFKENA